MKNFISALGFLTILPVPKNSFRDDGSQILYFPLIGLLIGILLCGVDRLLFLNTDTALRAIVDVLFLAGVSGALHLDGLADSADGLFAHRSRNRALEIMKDPRMGVMGALTVFFCLLLKIAGIASLNGTGYMVWLLAAPACARASQVAGLVFMDYARKVDGKSSPFFQKGKYRMLTLIMIPIALPFYLGVQTGIVALAVFLGVTTLLLYFFKQKLGGMTGDTLGATTEIIEISMFITGGLLQ